MKLNKPFALATVVVLILLPSSFAQNKIGPITPPPMPVKLVAQPDMWTAEPGETNTFKIFLELSDGNMLDVTDHCGWVSDPGIVKQEDYAQHPSRFKTIGEGLGSIDVSHTPSVSGSKQLDLSISVLVAKPPIPPSLMPVSIGALPPIA